MSGMRRVRLSAAMCLTFCSAALMSACSNAIDLGGRNDGGQGSDAAVGCTCAPSEACLEVTIERSADPALWTWVQFREPGVDGAGRLVMGLFDSGFRVVQRTAVPEVNLALLAHTRPVPSPAEVLAVPSAPPPPPLERNERIRLFVGAPRGGATPEPAAESEPGPTP